MHTFLNRANAVFAYAFSCVATVTLLCFLSTAWRVVEPPFSIKATNVKVMSLQQFRHLGQSRRSDYGDIKFDLEYDFSSVWNWNVKEVFIYVTAEYATPANAFNQIILWDHIVERGKGSDTIKSVDLQPEYEFWDDGRGLRGNKNISLALHWNIIPNAGTLPRFNTGKTFFEFEDRYWSIPR